MKILKTLAIILVMLFIVGQFVCNGKRLQELQDDYDRSKAEASDLKKSSNESLALALKIGIEKKEIIAEFQKLKDNPETIVIKKPIYIEKKIFVDKKDCEDSYKKLQEVYINVCDKFTLYIKLDKEENKKFEESIKSLNASLIIVEKKRDEYFTDLKKESKPSFRYGIFTGVGTNGYSVGVGIMYSFGKIRLDFLKFLKRR